MGVIPLVSLFVIALHVEGGGEAVEATHHEQEVVHHLDAEIATRVKHGGDRAPGVGHRAVGFCTPESVGSVKAAYLWTATGTGFTVCLDSVSLGGPRRGGPVISPPSPAVCRGTKPFQVLTTGRMIEVGGDRFCGGTRSTHRIYVFSISDYAYSTPPASHGCYDCPLITLSVVHFGCEQAFISIEPTTYVDLCEDSLRLLKWLPLEYERVCTWCVYVKGGVLLYHSIIDFRARGREERETSTRWSTHSCSHWLTFVCALIRTQSQNSGTSGQCHSQPSHQPGAL